MPTSGPGAWIAVDRDAVAKALRSTQVRPRIWTVVDDDGEHKAHSVLVHGELVGAFGAGSRSRRNGQYNLWLELVSGTIEWE